MNKALHGEIVPNAVLPAQSIKYLRPVKLAVVDRVMRGKLPSKTTVAIDILGDEGRCPVLSSGPASDGTRKAA